MRIDLKQIPSDFNIRPSVIAGETCYLVTPAHVGATWTKENLIFRSSIWNSEGELVSASFRKFFNLNEKPNLVPDPTDKDLKKAKIIEKMDGSTLIVSRYKGQRIIRTRGTFDAGIFDNAYELDFLKKKYSIFFELFDRDASHETLDYSVIFEWLSPANRIVLNYGDEPEINLIGYIDHKNYSYIDQESLDGYADMLGLKRPPVHSFDNIPNLCETVKAFQGKEGVCIYFNNEQDIKKVKSVSYLAVHSFKNELNEQSIIDLFLEFSEPDYYSFLKKIEENFDYECMKFAESYVSRVVDSARVMNKIINHMRGFVKDLEGLTRKEQALKIMSSYGNTNRSGMVFNLLDGKELGKEAKKKLLFQILYK